MKILLYAFSVLLTLSMALGGAMLLVLLFHAPRAFSAGGGAVIAFVGAILAGTGITRIAVLLHAYLNPHK